MKTNELIDAIIDDIASKVIAKLQEGAKSASKPAPAAKEKNVNAKAKPEPEPEPELATVVEEGPVIDYAELRSQAGSLLLKVVNAEGKGKDEALKLLAAQGVAKLSLLPDEGLAGFIDAATSALED